MSTSNGSNALAEKADGGLEQVRATIKHLVKIARRFSNEARQYRAAYPNGGAMWQLEQVYKFQGIARAYLHSARLLGSNFGLCGNLSASTRAHCARMVAQQNAKEQEQPASPAPVAISTAEKTPAPKVYTNSAARWFCVRPRVWRVEHLNAVGKVWEVSERRTRKEAQELAGCWERSDARDAQEMPPVSSDFVTPYQKRPARTPYFYRREAIEWAREARRSFGICKADGTAQSLAKHYLGLYREAVAKWQARFGV